ncbi:MAG: exodeoxyribonuclease VII large subunit, partial [Gemmatimonadales bacterium]
RGEISGLKVYQSGHWYFTLRDAEAQVRCTMWRTHAQRTGAAPSEGAQVFAYATPTLWEEKGEFRLNVTELLATEGLGAQQQALERTKAALQKDGLFDPARKRPLPPLPSTIAVLTSLDGAALRDIITVARKRWPAIRLLVIGTKVQGADADADLVRALGLVNRLEGVDLCLLARGGGSREDLAVFNNEAVCRALARVRIPTISAVGHETDISLTDLVADVRAPTPSAAVELALPDRAEGDRRLAILAERLAGALVRRTGLGSERLTRTADRLQTGMEQVLERRRGQLDRLGAELNALSPLRLLERGYGVARNADGAVLRRLTDFPPGSAFTLRVSDGEVPARVTPRP